ncbi:MAG: hypothetical protein ACLGGZ_03215, partial [Alphaproteobacteria bacterium]
MDNLIARQRMILTILVAMLLAGLYSYLTVPKEADPDVLIPFVFVSAPHPGISPEDAERLLVKPM